MIYRFCARVPDVETPLFLGGGGCISLISFQIFDLLVQSTISSYGTKYNKYLSRACTRTRAYVHAHTYAPTRTRTHTTELVIVQSTISITYGKKYNKSLLSYCIKYNK